jgi:hypothetical protein
MTLETVVLSVTNKSFVFSVIMPNAVVPFEPFVSYKEISFVNTSPGLGTAAEQRYFFET